MRPLSVFAVACGLSLALGFPARPAAAADTLAAVDAPQPPPEQHTHAVFPRQYVHQLGRKYHLAPRWIPRRAARENFDLDSEETVVHDKHHFRLFWTRRPRGHGLPPNQY